MVTVNFSCSKDLLGTDDNFLPDELDYKIIWLIEAVTSFYVSYLLLSSQVLTPFITVTISKEVVCCRQRHRLRGKTSEYLPLVNLLV